MSAKYEEIGIPKHWYNLAADQADRLPPPLNAATGRPLTYEDMSGMTPRALTLQETSTERYIEIPEAVRQIYATWRPTPLRRAVALERALQTPARIYYKYEGVSPTGSHKPNTAVAQAFYSRQAGLTKLTSETGAGQWGTALAFACAQFDLASEIWWAGSSYDQKPYRKIMMETFGATVHRSPSDLTETGRRILDSGKHDDGSIGIAVSEAVEVALSDPTCGYALGSSVNHVILHQTVVGEEAVQQMRQLGEWPDLLVACVGGGSGLGGAAFPFIRERRLNGTDCRVLAAEPTACPSLTRGVYAYDHGDFDGKTPLMKMYTLGHRFVPDPIHSGGLRYHAVAPLVSALVDSGEIDAVAIDQSRCFDSGLLFARTEGVVPAPESTHAVAAAVDEARRCKATGESPVILMIVSGHAHFDLSAYGEHLAGVLHDSPLSEDRLHQAQMSIPQQPVLAGETGA